MEFKPRPFEEKDYYSVNSQEYLSLIGHQLAGIIFSEE